MFINKICQEFTSQALYVWEEMLENPVSAGSRYDFSDVDERKFILRDIFRVFGVPADMQAPSDVVYSRIERCYYESSGAIFAEGKK